MTTTRTLSAALLGAATIIGLLAGCSSGGGTTSAGPVATASATAKPAPPTGKCIKGEMTIAPQDLDSKQHVKAGDCDTVYIVTNNATVTLGAVKKIAFEGKANTVTYTGARPEVVDGDDNTISAAS